MNYIYIFSNELFLEIFNNITNNTDKYLNQIREFLFFGDSDKNDFYNEKIYLDTNLKLRIEELKNIGIKNNNLELIDEYNFDSLEIISYYKSEIIRQITFIGDNDELLIDIVSVFGNEETLSVSKKDGLSFYNDTELNYSEVKKKFINILDEYLFNLEKSGIKFTILLSKYIGDNSGGGGGGNKFKLAA